MKYYLRKIRPEVSSVIYRCDEILEYYYDFNGIWISSTYDKKCLQLLIKDDFVEIPESEAALLL
jgi:hypothetical protein